MKKQGWQVLLLGPPVSGPRVQGRREAPQSSGSTWADAGALPSLRTQLLGPLCPFYLHLSTSPSTGDLGLTCWGPSSSLASGTCREVGGGTSTQ